MIASDCIMIWHHNKQHNFPINLKKQQIALVVYI